MTQPSMPNLPGFDAMNDTLELVRNMWGGMKSPVGIPGMVMPTLSVDEINKQIADLKAVESWLNLNMNMLRGTIQALEVQSATLSTLKSMSEAMGGNAKPPEPAAAASQAYSFNTAQQPPQQPPAPEPVKAQAQAAPKTPAAAPAPAAALADPAAWWNLLQAQFNQAVSSAVTPEVKAAPKAASKPAAASKKAPARAKAAPRKKAAKP